MKSRSTRIGLLFTGLCLIVSLVRADEDAGSGLAHQARQIFRQHCVRCHGGVRREGGLTLLTPDLRSKDEVTTPLVVPGNPDASELIRRVTTTDEDLRMPAEGKPLSEQEITVLRRWIQAGGEWPEHWAFQPIKTPELPTTARPFSPGGASDSSSSTVAQATLERSAIDHFITSQLQKAGLNPSPPADTYTLIRRLSLDLTGLPPTPEEADAFAADTSPVAYEQLVDRLLASPHFGERWGRHWLDKARYADSDGYEVDKPRPDAYHWRDWVIDAVNRDLPLDEFTIEQFAGDLLSNATIAQRIATGFHRQTLTNNEGGIDQEEYRLKAVLDRVNNLGTVLLGLTLGCAQCHDHPYDPFTQTEYYQLAAIFNNAEEEEIELPRANKSQRAVRKLSVLAERDAPRTTRKLTRGEFLQPGEKVDPDVLRGLHSLNASSPPGRIDRLFLARWLVDPANPLTRRVLANQIWMHLFGQGLVQTPEDFGLQCDKPMHAEMLDWLASELVERHWSRKEFIRTLVLSAAYRQSSHARAELAASDPLNHYFGRQNRLRVEAEIVRDLNLAVGGLLCERIGGPSVFPPLGEEFVKITFRSELPWKTSSGEDRFRRGMYTFFKRTVPYPDLMIFDCPDASAAAVQRQSSNTPLQALTTMNAPTFVEGARSLAGRIARHSLDHRQRLEFAVRACLTRPANATELTRLEALLTEYLEWYRSHPDDARALCGDHTPDLDASELAALTAIANVIMNLDEFLTRE